MIGSVSVRRSFLTSQGGCMAGKNASSITKLQRVEATS